jgi:hypothetical protein
VTFATRTRMTLAIVAHWLTHRHCARLRYDHESNVSLWCTACKPPREL